MIEVFCLSSVYPKLQLIKLSLNKRLIIINKKDIVLKVLVKKIEDF